MNVYSCIIYNSPKVETTQISINWLMDERNVVYPYNEASSGHKKECITVSMLQW